MMGRKCNKGSRGAAVPPDVNDPPSYIPLRSIEGRYQVVEELGNGSFGSVSLAKAQFELSKINEINDCGLKPAIFKGTLLNQEGMSHENYFSKSQGVVAIKTMLTRLPTLHDYTRVREIKFILSIPSNKHLIQIFEIFIDSKNYQLHIVMECMEQNLYQMMRHRRRRVFSIPSLKSILAQILAGLRHIHGQNFFHRDLKPENILISPSTRYFDKTWLNAGNYTDNYVVKLADFGLARHVQNKNPYTAYVSTRWYRSPEILLRGGYYSTPLDIWAFGCVAVEVTIFKPLFPGSNEMDQIWKILEVLGTPHETKDSVASGYLPHGGPWEDARDLAQRLNMKFPYVEGSGLDSLISSSQLQNLIDVIKCCLKWDPNERANVDQICLMPFFHGTILDEREKSKSSISNMEQALIFAGIKSSTISKKSSVNHTRKLIFHSENLLKQQQEQQRFEANNENYDDIIVEAPPHPTKDRITIFDNVSELDEAKKNFEPSFEKLMNIDTIFGNHKNNNMGSSNMGGDELGQNHQKEEDEEGNEEVEDDDEDDDEDDEINLSKEIAQNIALCQIPIFENGQFLPHSDIDIEINDKSIRQLADEIDTFNKQDPADSFSQYYSTTTNSNIAVDPMTIPMESNYVHHHHHHQRYSDHNQHQNNINIIGKGVNSAHSSLQPVNKLLDNMSIDDSFNGNLNNQYLNVIPRSFLLKEQMAEDTNKQLLELEKESVQFQHRLQNQNPIKNQHRLEQPYFGNVTF